MVYCGFFLALLFVFFNGFIGGFYTDFLFPSRAMMPSLSAYPEMTWEPISLCVRKGKLGAGEPWQGERVGRGNRRAGSETSHDEVVEIFGGWVA